MNEELYSEGSEEQVVGDEKNTPLQFDENTFHQKQADEDMDKRPQFGSSDEMPKQSY